MSRMSGPRRKKAYEFLARRDGECCFIGGESGSKDTLVIDHADNDNRNNRLVNLHIICPSMNAVKNPRGRVRRKLSSVCVSEAALKMESAQPSSAEFKKNLQAEPDFRHWLFTEIWRKGRLPLEEVIDCGAALARCSQESIRRYLRKECSRVRIYEIVEDSETKQKFVQFKPEWESHRKQEEQRRNNDRFAGNWREELIKDVAFIEEDSNKKIDEKKRTPDASRPNTAQPP